MGREIKSHIFNHLRGKLYPPEITGYTYDIGNDAGAASEQRQGGCPVYTCSSSELSRRIWSACRLPAVLPVIAMGTDDRPCRGEGWDEGGRDEGGDEKVSGGPREGRVEGEERRV